MGLLSVKICPSHLAHKSAFAVLPHTADVLSFLALPRSPHSAIPLKTSCPSWKTGEQLEFLISCWRTFKHAQDIKGLDKFWPKVFEDWYIRWPIPHSPSLAQLHGSIEEGHLVLQKGKNVVCYSP